jgi:hypothetical protein
VRARHQVPGSIERRLDRGSALGVQGLDAGALVGARLVDARL